MSTTAVTESIVVGAPLEAVWEKVVKADFSFWSIVKHVELDGGPLVGVIFKIQSHVVFNGESGSG
ncbi:hypothetical protein BC937DRAFT_86243 [Endogone sp. FLAS-F59071]|nr:hypothetical protein BC937DRAFT_86243 [Endogone sp. FLAS-F59071]|eukprot:RUS20173.1 hypothetical protein BC937DRAFT_86243 [Endogone sp. FLAS-F59071]